MLKEGEDFYFDEEGLMVLTEKYLKKRGHCCQSGCRHCPYGFTEKVDPNYPAELQNPWGTEDE
jgi:hypothetical protein